MGYLDFEFSHTVFHYTSESLSCVIVQGCRLLLSVLVTVPMPTSDQHRAQTSVVSSRKKWWYLIVLAQITTLPVLPELNSACFLLLLCISSRLRFFFNCVYFQFLRNFSCPLKKWHIYVFHFLTLHLSHLQLLNSLLLYSLGSISSFSNCQF